MGRSLSMKRMSRRRWLTLTGLVVLCVLALVVWLGSAGIEAWKSADVSSKPKQLGLCMRLWADEHGGLLPPLDAEFGRLMFSRDSLYPEYDHVPWMLISDVHEEACALYDELAQGAVEANRQYIDDHSFIYLGYAMTCEEEGLAFIDAYRERARQSKGFEEDIPLEESRGTAGTDTLFRLRTGIQEFLREKAAPRAGDADPSKMPVMLERPGHHRRDPGGWVLFLDGHCEFLTYPGLFPMTEAFVEGLESLDAMSPSR